MNGLLTGHLFCFQRINHNNQKQELFRMSFLDWSIVAIPLIAIVVIGVVAQHYTNSVAGFLAAGRKAGRSFFLLFKR